MPQHQMKDFRPNCIPQDGEDDQCEEYDDIENEEHRGNID